MCMSPGSLVHTTLPCNMSVHTTNIYIYIYIYIYEQLGTDITGGFWLIYYNMSEYCKLSLPSILSILTI